MSAAIGKQTPAADVSSKNSAAPATRRKSQPLGLNAKRVISKRYSLKDAKGRALEEWPDIVRRVVGHVSAAEKDGEKRDLFFNSMSDVMLAREFVPNTPCLVNRYHGSRQGRGDDSSDWRRHRHDLRIPATFWCACRIHARCRFGSGVI